MLYFPYNGMFIRLSLLSKLIGIKPCEIQLPGGAFSPSLVRVFYFERAERRFCLSVTLSGLTAAAEGELAEEESCGGGSPSETNRKRDRAPVHLRDLCRT